MAVALYTFRAAGTSGPTYYLVGDLRYRVRTPTEQAEMGISSADVRILQPTHPLFSLPVVNP